MFTKIKTFIKNFDWSIGQIVKVLALLFAGVVILAITIAILGMALRFAFGGNNYGGSNEIFTEPIMAMRDMVEDFDLEDFGPRGSASGGMMAKSVEAVPPMFIDASANEDTEKYEKVSYDVGIERYNIEPVCNKIEGLKPLDYVVFKSASRGDKYCSYRFSVKNDKEDEIANIVRKFDPKRFDVNINTREPAVSGNVFEREILQERLDSVKKSLSQAEDAYDDAIALATRKGEVQGLSALINGKLNLIERLSNKKRNLAQQLARLTKSGKDTINETEYAHFSVRVNKKEIADCATLASSWRYGVKEFVSNVNGMLQKLTFGLMLFALAVVKMLVYIFVLIVFVRFAWIISKRVWKWNGNFKKLLD